MTRFFDVPNTELSQSAGTELWVYGALPNYAGFPLSNLSFELDGSTAGSFVFPGPVNTGKYTYNVLLFHQGSLSTKFHEITLVNEPGKSLVLFDYMVYTCVTVCICSAVWHSS